MHHRDTGGGRPAGWPDAASSAAGVRLKEAGRGCRFHLFGADAAHCYNLPLLTRVRQRVIALNRAAVVTNCEMALSPALRYVDLTLECELCGHLIIRRGGYFWTVSTFKCQGCKGERRLTYSDKVALFAKHSHLA
jgi:hypothetical protein